MASKRIELGTASKDETTAVDVASEVFAQRPIPEDEMLNNVHVFLKRQTLSRLLFLDEIYRQILPIPGIIVECGVRWGGDLVTLASLRAIHEPYNYSRRIVGFDTFSGLAGVSDVDQPAEGQGKEVADGQYDVVPGYANVLERLLSANERAAPLPHIRKHELVVGDVTQTMPEFLETYPGEQIALLYLDMDIYQPTKDTLVNCLDRLSPGSIVVFDEYTHRQFPGEAKALREVSDRLNLVMRRSPYSTVTAYGIVQ